MKKEKSKRIVIDASIARAAGVKTEYSRMCRDLLEKIKQICHKVQITYPINQEWVKHNSNFARNWLAQMKGKKKFHFIDVPEKDELGELIEKAEFTVNEQKAMLKDTCLINGAMLSDKIIFSLDEQARLPFSKLAVNQDDMKDMIWINPTKMEYEAILEWLNGGAEYREDFSLGYNKEK
ncbi:hypothetical protein GF373_14855 [bacterium]|nr:hypothetical protein [bacterium]